MPKIVTARRLLILAALGAGLITMAASPSHAVEWVTPDEARMPKQQANPSRDLGAAPRVPRIEVIKPATGRIKANAPTEVSIKFIPTDGAKIMLQDVHVYYVTLLLDIDITDRLRTYISTGGIAAPDASFPAGAHQVKIVFADSKGNQAARSISFVAE